MTRAFRHLLVALLLLFVVGCGQPTQSTATERNLGDSGTGYSLPGVRVTGVVIWFHGLDSIGTEVVTAPKQPSFARELMQHGWAFATAPAAGNAFGNPESQQEYEDLIDDAKVAYGTGRILFIAESMGALPALLLYTKSKFEKIAGMVGVSPLMGVPPERRTLSYVSSAWNGAFPATEDPMTWNATRLAGRKFLLFASDSDRTVPPDASAQAFKKMYPSALINVRRCFGQHVDPSCYSATEVDAWLRSE